MIVGPKLSPLTCKTGCSWHLRDLGILERNDLPLVLFLYHDQRWTGFYFARLVPSLNFTLARANTTATSGRRKRMLRSTKLAWLLL